MLRHHLLMWRQGAAALSYPARNALRFLAAAQWRGVRGDAERYNESQQRCYEGEFGVIAGRQSICPSVAPCTQRCSELTTGRPWIGKVWPCVVTKRSGTSPPVTPNRLSGHPDSEVDCDGDLVSLSYALHDLGATEQENGRRGAAHAERASEGASDGKLVPGEFRLRREVDCLFFKSFSTIWLAAVLGRGGAARAEGAYTRGTGTNTGP